MEVEYHISLFLDTRRAKKNGKFPVKLRVFTTRPRKQKLYPTIFDFSKIKFQSIWGTSKPRKEYTEIREKLTALQTKAKDIAKELKPFTFQQFEKKLYRKAGAGENILYQYEQAINELKLNEQISTANTYELALKSIKEFATHYKKEEKEIETLLFRDVTKKWLNDYEKYMTNPPHNPDPKKQSKKRSLTTVSMYVRTLRTIFKSAIRDNETVDEHYPFGSDGYQIPAVRNVKKALSNMELKQLKEAMPETKEQQKAKDFWFFSYCCNGMNIKDIAMLRYKDLNDEKLIFYRAKTIRTSKSNLKPVIVYLNDHSKEVIEKYGNPNKSPSNYIFDIIKENSTAVEQQRSVKNFTKFINQNIKKLAIKNGLTNELSTYWARHSFASYSIRKGLSMEFVSEALNHSNLKVTQGYFSGFPDEDKKEHSSKIMDFS